jgi:hypothetical protein
MTYQQRLFIFINQFLLNYMKLILTGNNPKRSAVVELAMNRAGVIN